MQDEILKYGFPGLVIAGMGWFIMNVINAHRKERKEMMDQLTELTRENNKVIREHSNLLSGIKTLLENQHRR